MKVNTTNALFMNNNPNYKQIYLDILRKKFPDKLSECSSILQKRKLCSMDVLKLNEKIFGVNRVQNNQKHRSYTESDILQILEYQKKNKLNNVQLANHFSLSRNTVAKWKKLFS